MARTSWKTAATPALAVALASFATTVPEPALGDAHMAQPGKGVTVRPMGAGRPDHQIIYEALFIGLRKLGYTVGDMEVGTYPTIHLSLGQGDADFTAVHWDGLHLAYYDKSGGDGALKRLGPMYTGAVQGYFIDKRSAAEHGITNIAQMASADVRAIFDTDGDGKANLTGCNPGWGCERVIEHHLDAYEIRDHVNHDKGQYFALMADTITRYKEGRPIFYYTWMPNWIAAVLRPGRDVEQISVPFTSLPGERAPTDTTLPDGSNPGFVANNSFILANREFAEANPAAARFFELFRFPIGELSAAMLRMSEEGKEPDKLLEIATDWVAANQSQYDAWVEEAAKAGG